MQRIFNLGVDDRRRRRMEERPLWDHNRCTGMMFASIKWVDVKQWKGQMVIVEIIQSRQHRSQVKEGMC